MQVQMDYFSIKFYLFPVNFHSAYRKKHAFSVTLVAKNILNKLSLLKGDENFFLAKKFGGGS